MERTRDQSEAGPKESVLRVKADIVHPAIRVGIDPDPVPESPYRDRERDRDRERTGPLLTRCERGLFIAMVLASFAVLAVKMRWDASTHRSAKHFQ